MEHRHICANMRSTEIKAKIANCDETPTNTAKTIMHIVLELFIFGMANAKMELHSNFHTQFLGFTWVGCAFCLQISLELIRHLADLQHTWYTYRF